ncbi:hypothetical protein [Streptomyces sp. Ru72]|uniref:hypothetical protein n=1 Tax=Streptomyces sp. Ru72 TaxID=2080747 RepID=UPI0015E29E63|nr:hypothetical protein [Streptomyces sp. Ru72]
MIYPADPLADRRRWWLRRAVVWWRLRQIDQYSSLVEDLAGGAKATGSRWQISGTVSVTDQQIAVPAGADVDPGPVAAT